MLALAWPKNVDPYCHVFVMRCMSLRRLWYRAPHCRELLRALLARQSDQQHPGALGNPEGDWRGRKWNEPRAVGPIMLLLEAAHRLGLQ
eukprot:15457074-Alexandrium_andersonii.AAC.1